MPNYSSEHEEALRNPRPGFERGIVGLWKSLAELAQAHFDRYGIYISEDSYMSDEWGGILNHAHHLLSGETGRLDCGALSRQIEDLRTSGGSVDAVQRVREATVPKAKPKAKKVAKAPIGTKHLDERQRDLLSLVEVKDNVATYTGDRIPDWPALKSVMVALGGTWKTGKGGFLFPDDTDAEEVVRVAYETGAIIDPRAAEFFETPEPLANALAAWIDPQPGDRILEPSAGRGALVKAVQRLCPEAQVFVCEPLAQHKKELRSLGCEVLAADFMAFEGGPFMAFKGGPFDAVIMNPPFSKRQDIQHITRAASLLRPGGRLAAIASAGVLYRKDSLGKEFRDFVDDNEGAIEENPEGTFKESGTEVSTVTVKLVKS